MELFKNAEIGYTDAEGKEIKNGDILYFKTFEGGGFGAVGLDVAYTVRYGYHNTTDNSLHGCVGFYAERNGNQSSIPYLVQSYKVKVI